MPRAADENTKTARIMLGLLDAVEQDRAQSQRHLASELGIALGLVNAYLKSCVKKGLVKVRHAPARRYAYYLTPQGFAEKSRLTVEYLSYSFSFFRQARADCSELLHAAKARGVRSIVIIGMSDLAEIAALCALEQEITITGLVHAGGTQSQFIGVPVFADFDDIVGPIDSVLITDVKRPRETCAAAVERFGEDRVLVPDLLRLSIRKQDRLHHDA